MSMKDVCFVSRDTDRRRLERLLEIQRSVSQERDLERLPGLVMREVTELLGADRSTLFLIDGDTMELRACFAEGVATNKAIVVPLRMGIIGTAILQHRLLNLVDAYQHPYFNPEVDAHSGYRTESLLAAPIVAADGTLLGGIELLNKFSGRFLPEDELAIEAAAARFAAAGTIDEETAHREVAALREATSSHRGSVFRLDAEAGRLVAVHADGADNTLIALNLKLGIAGSVALAGEPLLISDAHGDPRFDPSFDRRTGYHTRNILCVPLQDANGEALGVIQVINCLNGDFREDDLALLNSVAGIVAIAVENAMSFRDADRQFHSVIEALAASIDARDTLTAGHSKRVAEIAAGIGRELGYTESDLDVMSVAALLHDYGKIGIDDSVLKKEGKLEPDEYTHMKLHAALTYNILDNIKFARKYRSVPMIASSHHETLDGSGYPWGLSALQIPYMAKILAVADVFEALTANRHYRQGMSEARAMEIIEPGIGRKFEGRVVDALKQYLTNGGRQALGLAQTAEAA